MDKKLLASELLKVAQLLTGGEDWTVTPEILNLAKEVQRYLGQHGGRALVRENEVNASAFPVDDTHAVPVNVKLYEGSRDKGKVIVNATITANGAKHPLPVFDRTPFDAKAVVDAVAEAFMSLVNHGR